MGNSVPLLAVPKSSGERWTPLVVRELLCGSTRFNQIRRGLPRMSATLLAQRLRKLEEIGVIERVKTE